MADFSDIPERISFLLDLHTPDLAVKKSQAQNAKSQLFHGPSVPSSVPEFLSAKLISLHQRVDYLNSLQQALSGLERNESISIAESSEKRDRIEKVKLPLKRQEITIQRYINRIIEDLSDELECSLRPDLNNAYSVLLAQVISEASGKQSRSKFKMNVLNFYEASRTVHGNEEALCQLSGWRRAIEVGAAPLVSKSLNEDSLVHLFGREMKPVADPRNALSLSKSLEIALDSGKIVFVPVPDKENAWKCVVTMSDNLDCLAVNDYTWNEINGRHLQFNNGGRPRKRYLLFRYLITYLRHKQDGNLKWAEDIDTEFRVWARPGNYSRQSTLRILLQQATGEELPEMMFHMFDSIVDSGVEDLSDKEKNHREEHISHVIASAVQIARQSPINWAEESMSESDEQESDD